MKGIWNMNKTLHFLAGVTVGAVVGAALGVLFAPRAGEETRAMAADKANDAWDSARDLYDEGMDQARTVVSDFGSVADVTTDELRAKVDLARERMDQLREQLNDAVAGGTVEPAADVVVETAPEAAEPAEPAAAEPAGAEA